MQKGRTQTAFQREACQGVQGHLESTTGPSPSVPQARGFSGPPSASLLVPVVPSHLEDQRAAVPPPHSLRSLTEAAGARLPGSLLLVPFLACLPGPCSGPAACMAALSWIGAGRVLADRGAAGRSKGKSGGLHWPLGQVGGSQPGLTPMVAVRNHGPARLGSLESGVLHDLILPTL